MVLATQVAEQVVAGLINAGVKHFVVSPGSRSQALALAVAQAEQLGAVKLHVAIDERSAGFFALGVAQATGIPAAVIVTSGTAVGNLLPAVMEADEGRVPLILLTADRPAQIHGTRANQTTAKQAGIFRKFTRLSERISVDSVVDDLSQMMVKSFACAQGVNTPAGPVQLNIEFTEPLSGGDSALAKLLNRTPSVYLDNDDKSTHRADDFILDDGYGTIVIAGAQAGDAAGFTEAAGLPLCAEIVSGARYNSALINYAQLIQEFGAEIKRAIVFGHPTLGREIPALLGRKDIETIVVDACATVEHPAYNPGKSAIIVPGVRLSETYLQPREWTEKIALRDAEISAVKQGERNSLNHSLTRETLVSAVWDASDANDTIVLAASRLVRVLDGIAKPRDAQVIANRGLAGIDGSIATALGAACTKQSGKTRVLIGDLAFLHDAGSLLWSPLEYMPNLHIIVGNDNGGTIFDSLEVKKTADEQAFNRVQRTPHNVDIRALALAYGWEYELIESGTQLTESLGTQKTTPRISEIKLTA